MSTYASSSARRRAAGLAAAAALLLTGCAGSTSGSATTSGSAAPTTSPSASPSDGGGVFPVTVAAANGSVAIDARPERIVSLSPTATEMLYAVGAGEQVAAVDDQSNYPADAPRTKLSGFEPNVEAISAEEPDLVLVASDTGGVVAALTKLRIPVLLLPAPPDLDGSYAQVEQIGAATGHVAEAAAVVAETSEGVATAVASAAQAKGLSLYHELDPSLFSANSKTFIGSVYAEFGLENIADAAPASAGDYPQLSNEFVVTENPDLVFLADTLCCQQTPETVAKRPGWDDVRAVRDDRVVALDDDIASRWGPRVVELAEQVAGAVAAVQAPAAAS